MTTYHGRPCKHCGYTERYVKGKECVVCKRATRRIAWSRMQERKAAAKVREKNQIASNNKQVAIDAKSRIYEGLECSVCNGVRRYIKSNNCVACSRNSSFESYHNKIVRKTPEQVWAELKPRFTDVKTDDEFKGRSYWI